MSTATVLADPNVLAVDRAVASFARGTLPSMGYRSRAEAMPARTEHGGRPLTLRSRARLTLRAALGTTVAASATPYGYTVSLWSSGALLMRSHGTPGVAEVFAFMAGAVTGSGLMGLLAQGALALVAARHSPPIDR